MSAQEALGELLETLVALVTSTREDAGDMWMEARLAPSISGSLFGIAGRSIARGFEERGSGSRIELRGVPRRQRDLAPRATSGVLVDEGSRH